MVYSVDKMEDIPTAKFAVYRLSYSSLVVKYLCLFQTITISFIVMTRRRIFAIILILFGLGLAYFDLSAYRPFKLGLDIRGGSHLIYQADTSALPAGVAVGEAMTSLREVIER